MARTPIPSHLWRNPVHWLSFGFGSGASPVVPGTMGTVIAIPIYLVAFPLPSILYILLTLVMFAVGVWLCEKTSHALGVHDHPSIVWDEIVGYMITMYAAPAGWMWVLIGFVLFRIFDIVKPWPVSLADQKISNGFGIMLDDVLAAVYAWIVMHLLIAYIM